MGIFDFFKKKNKADDSFPENELEKALEGAFNKTSSRNVFFQKLLWAELFVISDGSYEDEMKNATDKDSVPVRFWAHDSGHIPIFTSYNRVYDGDIHKEEVPTLQFKTQELFAFTKGHKFVLNPYSKIVKELTANEIDSLLDGTLYAENDRLEAKEKQDNKISDKFD